VIFRIYQTPMTDGNSTLPDQRTSATGRAEGSEVITRDEADISLPELESHLFECADIIRNRVDKTDYKEYILPLVFYKAFQDTYQDNYERVLHEKKEEGLDQQVAVELAHDEAFHEYIVPKEYRWDDLITANNTALAVDEALRKFEELNDQFNGISTVEYSDVDAFTQQEDNRLEELLRHLNDVNLSRYRVPPDMLGEAYMDLVKHFAEEEGRDGGEFFTPPEIVELMVKMLEPYEKDTSVHDPTCGSGGMLVQVAEHLQKVQQVPEEHWRSIRFTGQEINPTVYAMAQMNLAVHDVTGEIRKGDSLSNPQFTTSDTDLEQFDYILANFPFSARWDKDSLQDDPYERYNDQGKLPRADRGDYAFILHMAKQLKDTGQAAIVIPHGVLFRKHESTFREYLIEQDLIEAVVGLPENLFQNVSIASAILILNAEKPEKRKDQIQFIHASDEEFYEELSNQNRLLDDGIDEITGIFKDWKTVERRARTVSHDKIGENDHNLNIALYVDTTEPEEDIDVEEELEKLRDLQAERDEIESQMSQQLETLNYE
jgi:type I restriction enzyme M protein